MFSIETSILSRVKQTTSPGWMHETGAQVWCTGKTQRDGMGREGGSGWGTHVNPWLIHVNVWQKPLQYCKVISLQLIKINEKKNNNGQVDPFSKTMKTKLHQSIPTLKTNILFHLNLQFKSVNNTLSSPLKCACLRTRFF